MSSFSVNLDKARYCRYVFPVRLWESRFNKFSESIDVLLDTGSFNTVIHKSLVESHGVMLKTTMMTSVGGFKGDANICIIDKILIGDHVLEKVAALAVSFEGELKDHILLGTNVTNNWKLVLSRLNNKLEVIEEFSKEAELRQHPYRYCFNNKGNVMIYQEFQ
jgi:hypothetical protein